MWAWPCGGGDEELPRVIKLLLVSFHIKQKIKMKLLLFLRLNFYYFFFFSS